MNTGTVKFYNVQKGFGFNRPSNGNTCVFVHANALERAGIVAFDTAEDWRYGKIAATILRPHKASPVGAGLSALSHQGHFP